MSDAASPSNPLSEHASHPRTVGPSVPDATKLWEVMSDPRVRIPRGQHKQLLTSVSMLHGSNRVQWEAEDAARRACCDAELAATKRTIDGCNARRIGLIEGINDAFANLVPPCEGPPPLASQPGATCDQLSVLNLRLHVAMRDTGSEVGAQRLREVRRAVRGLIAAFDADLSDVLAGRRSFTAIPIHKIYGEP